MDKIVQMMCSMYFQKLYKCKVNHFLMIKQMVIKRLVMNFSSIGGRGSPVWRNTTIRQKKKLTLHESMDKDCLGLVMVANGQCGHNVILTSLCYHGCTQADIHLPPPEVTSSIMFWAFLLFSGVAWNISLPDPMFCIPNFTVLENVTITNLSSVLRSSMITVIA